MSVFDPTSGKYIQAPRNPTLRFDVPSKKYLPHLPNLEQKSLLYMQLLI